MLFLLKYTNFQIWPGMNVHNPRIMEVETREFIVQELSSLYNELKAGWNTWDSFYLKIQYLYLPHMSLWHLCRLRVDLIFGSLQKSFIELISSWTIYFTEINKDGEYCHLLLQLFTFIKAYNIRYFLIKFPFGITCY